jgi:antirestriction protein ArdC
MGGEEGSYAYLVHELLHATGHRSRLARATVGDYSPEGDALEEGTVYAAQRIVLAEVGFRPPPSPSWLPSIPTLPVAQEAAAAATAWLLGRTDAEA